MATSRNIRTNLDLKYVMLHHSEHNSYVTGKDINAAHVQSGLFGMPFDIVINIDGSIDLSPRWTRALDPTQYQADVSIYQIFRYTTHDVADACDQQQMNLQALHILVIGNFDIDKPTVAQITSLTKILTECSTKMVNVIDLLYHSDKVTTSCPGINFPPIKDLRKYLISTTIVSASFPATVNWAQLLSITAAFVPSVDLVWAGPTHPSLAYYKVYRKDVTAGETTFTFKGTSIVKSYSDPVDYTYIGHELHYVVTLYLSNGFEGYTSNEASAVVGGVGYPSYLYGITWQSIIVVDVRDVTNPVFKAVWNGGQYSVIGSGECVFRHEDARYIYYASYGNCLVIMDKQSDPFHPTVINSTIPVNFGQSVLLTESKIFININAAGGIFTSWDMSDLTAPVLIETKATSGNGVSEMVYDTTQNKIFMHYGNNYDRKWLGSLDFVPSTGHFGAFNSQLLSVGNPSPGGYGASEGFMYYDSATNKWYHYIGNYDTWTGANSIWWGFSNSLSTTHVRDFGYPPWGYRKKFASIKGKYGLFSMRTSHASFYPYAFLDMSGGTAPTVVSTVGVLGQYAPFPFIQDKYLYCSSYPENKMRIYDITDVTNPVLVGISASLNYTPEAWIGYPNDYGWNQNYNGGGIAI